MEKKIKRALISVYHKEGIEPIVQELHQLGVELISTGGTYDFIISRGYPCIKVDSLTQYPSMLHGRVKTLHPHIFGAILAQRSDQSDLEELQKYQISPIDLVIVDLYPFEETIKNGASETDIIEKIDIGGISLLRAAAKNFKDVLVVSSQQQYSILLSLLKDTKGVTSVEVRKQFAKASFARSSAYDTAIFHYFDENGISTLRLSEDNPKTLRYGENPHQRGFFFGDFERYFDKIQGKELSYNNLQDIQAAVELLKDFHDRPTFAVLKHTNPCGLASAETICKAWEKAYEADTESVFGGILIANRSIDKATAESIGNLFFEVLIAPNFNTDALSILSKKSKRILLIEKEYPASSIQVRSALGGYLVQDRDLSLEDSTTSQVVTKKNPSSREAEDCYFAQRIVKHCKSNAIVLVKNGQMLASGIGQTSRIAALKQAIEKASRFGFNLEGAVVASDAFFPFSDCVEEGVHYGISSFIQPGGSIRDKESIDRANDLGVSMIFTGVRHFKH